MSDKQIARQSEREENEAVSNYSDRLRKAKSGKLKSALRHAIPEERHHSKMFSEAAIERARKR